MPPVPVLRRCTAARAGPVDSCVMRDLASGNWLRGHRDAVGTKPEQGQPAATRTSLQHLRHQARSLRPVQRQGLLHIVARHLRPQAWAVAYADFPEGRRDDEAVLPQACAAAANRVQPDS